MVIRPAQLTFSAAGIPCSTQFDDVYHSAAGALGQAEHVFLRGNGLPAAWHGRKRFTIIETGFGLGLNFLATWAAWRADPQRSTRLHFISCELHPFSSADLAELHARWPELTAISSELRAQWPSLSPGWHRLHFDDDQVCLSLYLGEADTAFDQLVARADAFYLDGFSPAKNPQMWSSRLFHLLARCAADEASIATWSVAASVREHLRHARFEVSKAPGFGGKREMLCGRLRPRPPHFIHPTATFYPAPPSARHALIIGAGLAGCAAAERLAARGWQISLIDAAPGPAHGASGNLAGVLRPQPSLDDNPLSRLTRAGAAYGWRHIHRLQAAGLNVNAQACGVLHLAADTADAARMRAVVDRLALPASELAWVEDKEASTLAGWPLASGGWHFPHCGWVQPASLCTANLQRHPQAIRSLFNRQVARLQHANGHWQAIDLQGHEIARAPVLILAAGVGVSALVDPLTAPAQLPLRSARGQVAHLPASAAALPAQVLCGQGYLTPPVDGLLCVGASFDVDDPETAMRQSDHRDNLARITAMLPGYPVDFDQAGKLQGRVGFRPLAPDRLPLIGALPGQPQAWLLTAYGARGLAWAQLGAELLASTLDGDALPLERKLCAQLAPARFGTVPG